MTTDNYDTPDFSRVGLVDESEIFHAQEQVDQLLHGVEAELVRRGIPHPPRPEGHPAPLADLDITLKTNGELASLYTQYVAYGAYIGDELAKIEGLEAHAKKMLKETLANLKDAQFVKGVKGPEATARALKDPIYNSLDMAHLRLFFMKAILTRRYQGYTAQAAALSRTIELRKLDFEQSRRDGNLGYPGKQGAPRGFGAPRFPSVGTPVDASAAKKK
jgi:hypothetical protein